MICESANFYTKASMEFGSSPQNSSAQRAPTTPLVIPLAGYINESSTLPQVHHFHGDVVLDFNNFTGFNSSGIRKVVQFIKQLQVASLEFHNCPLALIDAINMIPELLGSANNSDIIKTIQCEFSCKYCSKKQTLATNIESPPVFFEFLKHHLWLCSHCQHCVMQNQFLTDQFYLFSEDFMQARAAAIKAQQLQMQVSQIRHDAKSALSVFEALFQNPLHNIEHSRPLLNFSLKRIQHLFETLNEADDKDAKKSWAPAPFNPELLALECSIYARHRGITMVYGGSALPALAVDVQQLERALDNLLLNAIEAARYTVDFS